MNDPVPTVPLLDPAYRRQKLMFWAVRQVVTVALAFWFWHLAWVRWLFAIAVVLALFNLGMLLLGGPFLQRRLHRAQERMRQLRTPDDADEEQDQPDAEGIAEDRGR